MGGGGVHKKKEKSTVILEPIFYLSKYSLLELYSGVPEANWEWVGSMVKGMGMCHKAKYKNDSILAWSLVNLVI